MVKISSTKVSTAHRRKRRVVLAVFAFLACLPLFLWSGGSPISPQPRAAQLAVSSTEMRTAALSAALRSWVRDEPSSEVIAAAAACTPRDATDAVLNAVAFSSRDGLRSFGVIDVGANKGYPVTRLGLQHRAKWVLSVEPDPRNYKVLEALPAQNGTVLAAVRGAVSDEKGTRGMAFDDARDDFTCFGCLNMSREGVREENVTVHTVDGLVMDGLAGGGVDKADVALFKTDTQGHEDAVLRGAKRLLASGRVLHAIMEFDPKLLRTEKAMAALRSLFEAGLQCLQLSVAPLKEEEKGPNTLPVFGEPVNSRTAHSFYEFIKASDKYTDVLCARRAG